MKMPLQSLPILLLTICFGACSGDPPASATNSTDAGASSAPAAPATGVQVAEVQMARSARDGSMIEPTTQFASDDLITAVVLTLGSGRHQLSAHWYYGSERLSIHRESHDIEPAGEAAHSFGIAKADGFPPGEYQVEILLDGSLVASRDFTIE
jgi:hypothetical protein